MTPTLRATDARAVRAWDSFVLFWVILWIVIGAWTGVTLWQAADTGDTIAKSGRTLDTTGSALAGLGNVPIIGDETVKVGEDVVAAGEDITERGALIKGQLRRLAVLQGVSIVAIPIIPVIGFYFPLRVMWRRQVRTMRSSLRESGGDPSFDSYLAHRARGSLPYAVVSQVEENYEDEASRNRRLADLELLRMGLRRPRAAEPA